jgi:hypothetical protein
MAVGLIMDFKGGTLDQYDQVLEKMALSDGSLPDGGVFHWVTETDDGFRVTDVWESRAQFDKFAEEQIGPYSEEVGIPNPPEITEHEVHNSLKG